MLLKVRSPFSHDRPHNSRRPFSRHVIPPAITTATLLPSPTYYDPTATHDTLRRGQDGQNAAADTPRHPTNLLGAKNDPKRLKPGHREAEGGQGSTRREVGGACKVRPPFFYILTTFSYPTNRTQTRAKTGVFRTYYHPFGSRFDATGYFRPPQPSLASKRETEGFLNPPPPLWLAFRRDGRCF